MKTFVAHGISMFVWMMEFESDIDTEARALGDGRAPDDEKARKLSLWHEAMQKANTDESRCLEQSNRVTLVHPADEPCQFCPPPFSPQAKKKDE